MMLGRKAAVISYNSPRELAAILRENNLALKKRFGQNFLVNPAMRSLIIDTVDPFPGCLVWEIGPGLGAMTGLLLDRRARVTAFEIDHGFCAMLNGEFSGNPDFRLVPGDVIDTWSALRSERPDRIMGNLPYSSGAVIIATFLETGFCPCRMVFLLQKEVAERLAARPGEASYGSLSVLCQAHCRVVLAGEVKPGSFFPAPRVQSTIACLEPSAAAGGPGLPPPGFFAQLARDCFRARRKTLRNNLLASAAAARLGSGRVLEQAGLAGLDLDCRAESLPPSAFVDLAGRLSAQ
jgi:16S rRNA (adenine1518-N6/adenine1519-N6)-dimethyltransferase